MKNLVILTSVIDTPNKPLSYSSVRSVYSREERFNQTKRTISSLREKIPDVSILIVECSKFEEKDREQYEYLRDNSDYFYNLWDRNELHEMIFGVSKSLAEGVMTIEVIRYIIDNKLEYDNYYKISGRYYINDKFDYKNLDNDKSIFFKEEKHNIINTTFYKVKKDNLINLHNFLINNYENMCKCIGYEDLIMIFTKEINKDTYNIINGSMYTSGLISVDGSKFNINI